MVFKLELLIQVAPLIILGVRLGDISAQALLIGLLVGCVTTVLIKLSNLLGFTSLNMSLGIHAGMWGLLLNVVTVGMINTFAGWKNSVAKT